MKNLIPFLLLATLTDCMCGGDEHTLPVISAPSSSDPTASVTQTTPVDPPYAITDTLLEGLRTKHGKQAEHLIAVLKAIQTSNDTTPINQTLPNQEPALYTATRLGEEAIVCFLLQHGADPNIKNKDGETPLHAAVTGNKVALVQDLLNQQGEDINALDNKKRTPIFKSLFLQDPSLLRELIKNGADPNMVDKYGRTLLHDAIAWEKTDFVNLLLENPLSVNIQDQNGSTPLHEAVESGQPALLNKLLAVPTLSVNLPDNNNLIPFHTAIKNNQPGMATTILAMGKITLANLQAPVLPGTLTALAYAKNQENKATLSPEEKAAWKKLIEGLAAKGIHS